METSDCFTNDNGRPNWASAYESNGLPTAGAVEIRSTMMFPSKYDGQILLDAEKGIMMRKTGAD